MHGRHEHNGCDQHDDRERAHVRRILPAASWQTRGTMTKKLLLVVLVAGLALAAWLVLHGRGHGTTGVATTTTSATIPVKAYFYRGAGLVPVVVRVPKTDAVATAAVRALLAGPPAGFSTAIPAGAKLKSLTVPASGVATANFSQELANAPRTAQAQIVYTLTQFPTVKGVVIDAVGAPVRLSNGAGRTAYTPVSRDAYIDLTPDAPIFVETPKRDSTVSSPVEASGTAVVFEATFAVDIYADGKLLRTETITTSAGAPERGTWAITLDLPPGARRAPFLRAIGKGRLAPARDRACPPRHLTRPEPRRAAVTMTPLERSPVAQLAERSAVNRNVVGSSPTRGATKTRAKAGFALVHPGVATARL